MSLGHKDIVQNLVKIEQGAHSYIDYQSELLLADDDVDGGAKKLRSPTIRELLIFETETDVNPPSKLPRLTEKSASMGLLWVRRQLNYQTLLFKNVLIYSSFVEAVSAAYKEVYDRYHGWAVQKIFNYSFQAAPDAEVIYKHMNPRKLAEVTQSAKKLNPSGGVPATDKRDTTNEKEDNPVIAFFNHIGGEWDKFASNVGKLLGHHDGGGEMNIRGGSTSSDASRLQQGIVDRYVTSEMIKDAHGRIKPYLDVAFPLLDDLSTLFDDLNMDDPTRV